MARRAGPGRGGRRQVSAFRIPAANSRMQTPAGFTIGGNGKFQVTSWWQAVFTGVGVLVILPVILAHLGYAHWIFRGKATPESGSGGP